MWDDSEANAAARERMSALLDGELDRHAVTQACVYWRESAESREAWHAYHLIGDVLRSDDLARLPSRDAGFLNTLRSRLKEEPVVLAPQSIPFSAPVEQAAFERATLPRAMGAPLPRRRSWIAPVTVAAGFVAVAGVLTLTRPDLLPDRSPGETVAQVAPSPSLGTAGHGTPTSLPVAPIKLAAEPQTFVASNQLIRDARLDRYLAAHQQFAGSSALGMPSAYLRNATAEIPGR
jgi:sigma-E factor negative regulatory protein RseA